MTHASFRASPTPLGLAQDKEGQPDGCAQIWAFAEEREQHAV